jgi:hypothetical protein
MAKKGAEAVVTEETNGGGANSGGNPNQGTMHEGGKRRGSVEEAKWALTPALSS